MYQTFSLEDNAAQEQNEDAVNIIYLHLHMYLHYVFNIYI